ncbi:MAG: MCE family protein [Solirubrobacterales bacterium]|nr:MCE family protein [Solirubrobacterales bacterium]
MPKGNLSLSRILVIVGFSLSCFALLLFLWLAFGGPTPFKPKGYRFQAAFSDATTLAEQADVRISGISVGKVVDKELAPGGNRTLATIELKSDYAPLPADARAILRQKTLLGETYVELTPGTRSGPKVPDGGRLKQSRVAETVEFDELLRAFDPDTRRAFRDWQQSSAKAFGGEGETVSSVLGALPAFTEEAADVTGTLRRRREALASLIRGTGGTFEALTRNEQALRDLITENRTVMGSVAARRDALAQTIKIFPTFLRESRATLRRTTRFAKTTDPLVRDLGPVLRDTQPALASLRGLSPDLRQLFRDLDPLVAAGRTGLPAMSRVLRGLEPTLAATGPLLQQLNPILQYLELNQSVVSDFLSIGPSALAGKRATAGPGSNGHVLPQLIVLGSQSLPARERTPDNRGNAYFAPGALAGRTLKDPDRFTLPSFDCANSGGDKPPTDTPGCAEQGPIPFQGRLTKFPQVRPAGPGGVDAEK